MPNETLFVSLSQARSVLDAWRTDYNGVRPHSALANKTPEEYRAQHIAVAASAGNGQTSAQDSTHDWKEDGSQVTFLSNNRTSSFGVCSALRKALVKGLLPPGAPSCATVPALAA